MIGVTVVALIGVTNSLLGKLSILLGREYNKLRGVQAGITSLRDELISMKAALEDLSQLEDCNSQVNLWKHQLQELSYDIEDCIDIFLYSIDHGNACDGIINKIVGWLRTLKVYNHTAKQIIALKERAAEVNDRRKRLKLDSATLTSKAVDIDPRLPALFEEAERLVGIDGPRDELAEWLTKDNGYAQNLKVVSIVGFGGLGKTTLACQVYQKIKCQFDCTAFVSVSRNPNINKILRDILSEVLYASNPMSDYQKNHFWRIKENLNQPLEDHQLINMIKEYLKTNRYFIVIDDIWSKSAWEIIQCAFPYNNTASRIMTTTRIQDVAQCCCFKHEDYVYDIKPLSSADSRKLFLKRIFGNEDTHPTELKEITDEILRKCSGLPLAIINIASLLSTKPVTKQEWKKVWNSIGCMLKQNQDLETVKRILFLSYYDLPHQLKLCLLHISVFPEDHEIKRERLIWRWIAEGLITEQQGVNLEEVGEKYFNELVNRNMVQPVDIDYNGRAKACRVHDIMLDLIICLSIEENFVTIIDDQKSMPSCNKVRRLSLQTSCEKANIWLGTNRFSQVRSLNVFGDLKQMPPLFDLQVLRVLDLEDCSSLKDGDIENIGSLFQLRYLSLRNSHITRLPAQIGNLQLLQTLDLRGTRIKELPETITQLQQLVRLLLGRFGVKMPKGISNMKSLEELVVLDGSKNSMDAVVELGDLTNLKVFSIYWHPNGEIHNEGRYTKSIISSLCKIGEHNLRSIHITHGYSLLLDFLVDSWYPPPRHLEMFRMVSHFYFRRLPIWMSSLSELTWLDINIKQLGVEDMQVLQNMPALLCLKLYLEESPQETLVISRSGFRSLKVFYFYPLNCELGLMFRKNKKDGLGLMFEEGATPKLQRLEFRYCAHDAISAYGVGFDFGIKQLTSLKHLRVSIHCRGASAWEVEAAEASIRNTAYLLPNHPILEMYRLSEHEMVKDEVQWDEDIGYYGDED
ncbi:disease resistance protein Pik-2-like [Oryza brachyantha]|uniref:NB-ARC domain-containing protein n=1 Tax=Oryza brachyantha TaxID=4533 RepID=J3MSY0_ORYBR|nr:disease resistance protein Pik-2-like [Oryza brachyantha]XP_040383027.1 disease resistance protein Pik-2-like [Oryza brachyantha]